MINYTEKNVIVHMRRSKNLLELSRKIEYPKSTLYDALHRLESKGIIRHANKIAFEKIGYPIKIFINMKTLPKNKQDIRNYLENQKNINSLFVVNDPANFHFEAIFKNQKEVGEFLEELETQMPLKEITVFNVLETIHSEKFLVRMEDFD